jgi:hypothetical protein
MSDDNDKPKEPGVLAVPGPESKSPMDKEVKVEQTGNKVVDRVKLLFHLHSEKLGIESGDLDDVLRNSDRVEKLLNEVNEKTGAPVPDWKEFLKNREE